MNEPIEPDRPDAEASPEGPSESEIADISPQSPKSRWAALEVLWVALRLGLTSFGGPIAHLGYFREEYVVQRRWLDETIGGVMLALGGFPTVGIFCLGATGVGGALVLLRIRNSADFLERIALREANAD